MGNLFTKHVFMLILILTMVAGAIAISSVAVLYDVDFEEECQRLQAIAEHEADLMEAIARFDQLHIPHYSKGTKAATISQLQEAYAHYSGVHETDELTVAERRGEYIRFVLQSRRTKRLAPESVPHDGNVAEPMRLALAGQSGIVVGLDYRGTQVLAAYAPVDYLGLGVVAKTDLTDIRNPFINAGLLVVGTSLSILLVGAFLLFRVSNPMIKRLQESEERFRGISKSAQDAVIVMESDGKVSFWNAAAERIFGYPSQEALGRRVSELVIPEQRRESHEKALERLRCGGRGALVGRTAELEGITKDGAVIPVELSLSVAYFGGDWRAIASVRDIAKRKEAARKVQQRQELIEQIIENIPLAVFWKDSHSVYLGCNHQFAQHTSLKMPEDVIGKTDYDLAWNKEQADFIRQVDSEVMGTGKPLLNNEQLQFRADGTRAMLLSSKVPLRDQDGTVVGLLGVYTDITERKQAEDALQAKTSELEAIYAAQPDLLFRFDTNGTILDFTRGARAPAPHLEPAQFLGKRVQDLLPEEIGQSYTAAFRQISSENKQVTFEYRLAAADGEHDCEIRLVPLQPRKILGLVRDVTERKEAERALAERETQLRLILSSTGEGIFGINTEGNCVFANRACAQLLGYRQESELLGKQMHPLTHHTRGDGSPYPVEECPTFRACRLGKVTQAEGEILWRADGSHFPAAYQSHPMVRDGKVIGAVVTFTDITERQQAEREIRAQRDFAESLIETAQAVVLLLDLDGRIVRFNRFLEELSGFSLEDMRGKDWFTSFLPVDEQDPMRVEFYMTLAEARDRETTPISNLITNHGEERVIAWNSRLLRDMDGRPQGLLSIGHDITEAKRQEAQLIQAQKMEAMGRLTSSIAHDFNNLLTIILGNIWILEKEVAQDWDQDYKEILEDTLSAAGDGAALTHRLLTFSRKGIPAPERLEINPFLLEFQNFLRRAIGESIRLELKMDPESPAILVDPSQLESALLNLAINSRDAIPHGGTITIRSQTLKDPNTPELKRGSYVRITVTDTGIGMSPEVAEHAIEPFYTTKASAQGSGLGLSTVYSFAKNAGGTLLLETAENQGTSVSLLLPEATVRARYKERSEEQAGAPEGTETILVVEDETRVRKLAQRYLKAMGYRVLEAEDAVAAIAALEKGDSVDLVFSDIVLPGSMDGRELGRWLAENRPEVKVLFTTGSNEQLAALRESGEEPPVVEKPYTKELLAKRVRDRLDA